MKIPHKLSNFLKKNKSLKYLALKREWKKIYKTKSIPDTTFAKSLYKRRTGLDLNLNNPKTFNEKLWYLKLNYKDPLMTKCTDKYLVRDYVKDCGLSHMLNELYAVYDDAKEIDFDSLPAGKVFFKCNHTSGYNRIYDKNEVFNKKDFIRTFNFALKQNYYYASREWNYKDIKPKIICEKVLNLKGLLDYRLFCVYGEVKFMFIDADTCSPDGTHFEKARRNIYDADMNLLEFSVGRTNFNPKLAPKPDNFNEMRSYAEILSKPFPLVRVDFYNTNGKIIFGEMTFYHGGCCQKVSAEKWDLWLGNQIDISGIKVDNTIK